MLLYNLGSWTNITNITSNESSETIQSILGYEGEILWDSVKL